MINAGRFLLRAGDEALLTQLPADQWIGGTAANFMTAKGGAANTSHIFYTDLTDDAAETSIRRSPT